MTDSKRILSLEVYEGDEPFVYICCSPSDMQHVLPYLEFFHRESYRFWYNQNIDPSPHSVRVEVANRLQKATFMLLFLSANAAASKDVFYEIMFAQDESIPIVIVFLENVSLPPVLKLQLGAYQQLYSYQYKSMEQFLPVLLKSSWFKKIRPQGTKRLENDSEENGKKEDDSDEGGEKQRFRWWMLLLILAALAAGVALLLHGTGGEEDPPDPDPIASPSSVVEASPSITASVARASESPVHTPTPRRTPSPVPTGTPTATPTLSPSPTPTVAPTPFTSVGEHLVFGSYQGEDIQWRVLAYEEDRALVIAEQILDSQRYHSRREDVTWETCTLREWLSSEFYNNAFSDAEKARIAEVTLENHSSTTVDFDGPDENDTKDKVFLLSLAEALRYFEIVEVRGPNPDLIAKPTKYALQQGALRYGNGAGWWWLRSPRKNSTTAAFIYRQGGIDAGNNVNKEGGGVRPALWLLP